MRIQPWEALVPTVSGYGVPWKPTESPKPIQRVPNGLLGPGGICLASLAHSELGAAKWDPWPYLK